MSTTTAPYLIELVEGQTPEYHASLVDGNGAAVASSALTGARITLYSVISGVIINGRNNQSILNANNVTIDNLGAVVWKIMEADTIPVETGIYSTVDHRAVLVFEWTDGGGTPRQQVREITLRITVAPHGPF